VLYINNLDPVLHFIYRYTYGALLIHLLNSNSVYLGLTYVKVLE